MPSQTKENYLKALYSLANAAGAVLMSDLSREMGVSTPTVNSMVKKLQEQGWVTYHKYQPLQLTESGRREAARIIRKHRIAEMFLAEQMGFGWEEVHDIAEELEHIDSEALFERMDAMLGRPTVDPHGSPIPDRHGVIEQPPYLKLSEVAAGETVRLRAITRSSTDFLRLLNSKQIKLGTEIRVLRREPFDQSVSVTYDGFPEVMLSQEVCLRLLVELNAG
jgi:DtxR family Mn-dependent transcriptional regulator